MWTKDKLPNKEEEILLNTNGTINIAKLVVATPDVLDAYKVNYPFIWSIRTQRGLNTLPITIYDKWMEIPK
jgi:hypothetical protein